MNDIDKATNAKFQVEQKQRSEARERKETSGEWENRVINGNHHYFNFINYRCILFSISNQLVIRGSTKIHCYID